MVGVHVEASPTWHEKVIKVLNYKLSLDLDLELIRLEIAKLNKARMIGDIMITCHKLACFNPNQILAIDKLLEANIQVLSTSQITPESIAKMIPEDFVGYAELSLDLDGVVVDDVMFGKPLSGIELDCISEILQIEGLTTIIHTSRFDSTSKEGSTFPFINKSEVAKVLSEKTGQDLNPEILFSKNSGLAKLLNLKSKPSQESLLQTPYLQLRIGSSVFDRQVFSTQIKDQIKDYSKNKIDFELFLNHLNLFRYADTGHFVI